MCIFLLLSIVDTRHEGGSFRKLFHYSLISQITANLLLKKHSITIFIHFGA